MADRTRTEAIKAVLESLKVLDRAGTVTSPDSDRVQRRYDAAIKELRQNDITDIADPVNAIPEAAFLALVDYVTEKCRTAFHQDPNPQAMALAERTLRSVDRNGRTIPNTVAARLCTRILRGVRRLEPTQYPSTEELADSTSRINGMMAELARRNVIYLGDVEDVEQKGAFEALADYMVAIELPEENQDQSLGRAGTLSLLSRRDAEARLRRIGAGEPTFTPLVVSYI